MNALAIVQQFHPHVTHVEDALIPLMVHVEAQDSTRKGKQDHKFCALAQACMRSMSVDGAIISRTKAYLIEGNTATRYILPESVVREVVSFDRGHQFMPGVYKLNAVSKMAMLGVRKKYKNRSGSRTATTNKLAKRFQHITIGIRSSLL